MDSKELSSVLPGFSYHGSVIRQRMGESNPPGQFPETDPCQRNLVQEARPNTKLGQSAISCCTCIAIVVTIDNADSNDLLVGTSTYFTTSKEDGSFN